MVYQEAIVFTGEQLKKAGMSLAIDSANNKHSGWSDMAFEFLQSYIRNNQVFLTEDLRLKSTGVVPEPPSLRAWGGIMAKACKQGLIKKIGFQNVKNVKAHCTPATLWQSNIF